MSDPQRETAAPDTREPWDVCETEKRVEALRALDLIGTQPEPEFNDLVEIAALICEAPIGLISLLDEQRQWFKASVGTDLREVPVEHAFCAHTLRARDLMIVPDAIEDKRFNTSPFVAVEGGVRFYAGVPISCAGGPLLGTLCVLDTKPRLLGEVQKSALRVLAQQVEARLELRAKRQAMQQALAQAEEMKRKLALSEQMFRSFMNNGPFHAFMKSAYGSFLYYNKPLADYLHLSETEFLGKRDLDMWPPEAVAKYRIHDLEVLRSGQLSELEEEVLDRSGQTHRWRTYKFPCVSTEGDRVIGAISLDVTAEVQQRSELERSRMELEAANRRLIMLAQTDALTGLPNRRAFDERLAFEWARARREGHTFSVALFDLDNFKRCNDTYGHPAGDAVLQRVATLVAKSIRADDLFARYGGEEFALLLPDTDEESARVVLTRLLQTLRSAEWEHEPMTSSAGVATCTHGQVNRDELMRRADQALYAAKRGGKDRAVFSGDLLREAVYEMDTLSLCVA